MSNSKKPQYMLAKERREETNPTPPIPEKEEVSEWQLQKLKSHHHKIIYLYLAKPEWTNKQIAAAVDVTPQTVSNTLNSRVGQRRIKLMRERLDDMFLDEMEYMEDLSKDALRLLESFMLDEGKEDRLRAKIARDILDRAGKREAQEHHHKHAHITVQDLQEMKDRASMSEDYVGEE